MNAVGKVITKTRFGYNCGFRFIEDNKVASILRYGLFDRFEGPGHFWINPYEEVLGTIHTGIRSAEFEIKNVLSADKVPHKIMIDLVYMHNPCETRRHIQPGLARLPGRVLKEILRKHADSALRLISGRFLGSELTTPQAKLDIQRELFQRLSGALRWAGVTFLKEEVLLKEILPPRFHLQSILNEIDLKMFMNLAEQTGDPTLMERMARIHRQYELSANTKQIYQVENLDSYTSGNNGRSHPGRSSDRGPRPYLGELIRRFPN